MTRSANRTAIALLVVMIFLVTACSQLIDNSAQPSSESSTSETTTSETTTSAATIDIDEIAAAILSEVEAKMAIGQDPVQEEVQLDQDEIISAVLGQVEKYLAENEEPNPVALMDDPLQIENLEGTLINLYRKTNPAVVYIIVPPLGSGSGFVFSSEGHIVTNNHVVELGREFEVVFSNGERRSAELVGRDVDSDLAVIQVNQLPPSVRPLPIRSSADLQVGQFVAAIGNPFGEQGSMSLGIISGLDRSLSSQRDTSSGSSYSLPEVIQTDAPINPGNSGGPLLNLDGEVIGVNSAIRTTTGTNSGVGFSIPSDAILRIIPNLIEDGSYNYPYMGVSFDGEITLNDQSAYGISQTQGAYVVSVTPGGPADNAGLIPGSASTGKGGDLIIEIDGVTIDDFADLNSYLVFHTSVGQTIEMTVIRDGEKIVVPLTLGDRPEN
ncbi:MAG TPA: trypsin-like peptidase domain-containing protein [candidate division Zixibacteria bacterium]|nr:trypsin-like peptidase domain-containing protein [candidate division Zixibacteria bacterium]